MSKSHSLACHLDLSLLTPKPDQHLGKEPRRIKKIGQDFVVWIFASRRLRACVLITCLLLLLKPPLSSLLGKYVVKSVRIIFSRLCDLIALILEGLLDEAIYQLDRLFKVQRGAPCRYAKCRDSCKNRILVVTRLFSSIGGRVFTSHSTFTLTQSTRSLRCTAKNP